MKNLIFIALIFSNNSWADDEKKTSDPKATALVLQSEQQTQGNSLKATISMAIHHGTTERNLKFKIWQWKREKALVKIVEPLKDLDTSNLRLGFNLWQFLPNIERVVRIPPSMMLQNWMGSDFTNDDLVKTSSLSRDYTHAIEGKDTISNETVTKIVCIPKPDAPVVWGKIRLWLRPKDGVPLRQEFFSEHGELLKIMNGSDIKTYNKHTLPTILTMTVTKKPGDQTTMNFIDPVFDETLPDSIFTQENLKRSSNGSSK